MASMTEDGAGIVRIVFADKERKAIQRKIRGGKTDIKIQAYYEKSEIWFDIYDGNGKIIQSINGKYVLMVEY